MMYGVPQYIDVEDKIAGPLTAKQLGWLVAMGVVFLILYNILEKGAFFAVAIPIAIIFVALAFYRPNGQPLTSFIGSAFSFAFSPKVYVWKRTEKLTTPKAATKEKPKAVAPAGRSQREIELQNISGFARMLDSEGAERDSKVMEILHQRNLKPQKKK